MHQGSDEQVSSCIEIAPDLIAAHAQMTGAMGVFCDVGAWMGE